MIRDVLHNRWEGQKRWYRMLALIGSGCCLISLPGKNFFLLKVFGGALWSLTWLLFLRRDMNRSL